MRQTGTPRHIIVASLYFKMTHLDHVNEVSKRACIRLILWGHSEESEATSDLGWPCQNHLAGIHSSVANGIANVHASRPSHKTNEERIECREFGILCCPRLGSADCRHDEESAPSRMH